MSNIQPLLKRVLFFYVIGYGIAHSCYTANSIVDPGGSLPPENVLEIKYQVSREKVVKHPCNFIKDTIASYIRDNMDQVFFVVRNYLIVTSSTQTL